MLFPMGYYPAATSPRADTVPLSDVTLGETEMIWLMI